MRGVITPKQQHQPCRAAPPSPPGSLLLADISAINHVTGWLRSQRADGSNPHRTGRHYVEDVGVWDRA